MHVIESCHGSIRHGSDGMLRIGLMRQAHVCRPFLLTLESERSREVELVGRRDTAADLQSSVCGKTKTTGNRATRI